MAEDNVQAIVDEMKTEKKFNARDAINGVTYPTGEVTVYLDGALAHEMNEKAHRAAQLRVEAIGYSAESQGGITDSPEKEPLDAEADALEAEVETLIERVRASALTFHLRGVAPAVWRAIDKAWRAKIKPTDKTDEDDVLEANIERNARVNEDLIAHAIVKVVSADGSVDSSGWKQTDVESLHAALLETEFEKLRIGQSDLTFAHTLFNATIAADADFLPKP